MFIKHLNSSAVMDLLLKIISCDDDESFSTIEWLNEQDLIPRLVERFSIEYDEETHENAAHALVDIISVSTLHGDNSPLMIKLNTKEVISSLMSHMFDDNQKDDSSLYFGLDVAMELVARSVSEEFDDETPLEECPISLQVVLQHVDHLISLLNNNNNKIQLTTMGNLIPLGFRRLKVVEFCSPLFVTNRKAIDDLLCEKGLMDVLLDLFFTYEWNNFLHQVMEHLLRGVLLGKNESLKQSLLIQSGLAKRIIQSHKESIERFESGGLKKGNDGFISLIALHIINASKQSDEISKLLNNVDGWKEYEEGPFEELQKMQSVADTFDQDSDSYNDSDSSGMFSFTLSGGMSSSAFDPSSSSEEESDESGEDDNLAAFQFGNRYLWEDGSEEGSTVSDDEMEPIANSCNSIFFCHR